jgi:hypothetical protein
VELTRNQFTIPQKFGPEIQQRTRNPRTKERNMVEQIPYKYSGNKNSTTIPQITIKCNDADGYENKEECPIFTNGTENEVLIQAIETIIVLGNRYDWKESGAGKEKQILRRIDRANAHMKQATEKLSKIKVKEDKEEKTGQEKEVEKGGANMFRLKNHDHAWSECPNNPISKNFSGKSYTEIPASERYEKDFGKKAEKMAKEEKETKKTVSIKKDLHAMTGRTSVVKIDDEVFFEDDDFSQFR